MTTALFLLRSVELGLYIFDLDLLTIVLVNDMYTEKIIQDVLAEENNNYISDTKDSNVLVSNDGISINGKFYTQEEFTNLLGDAILVSENATNRISTRNAAV